MKGVKILILTGTVTVLSAMHYIKFYYKYSWIDWHFIGWYEAVRIDDVKVNYGRMTPLSESAFDDVGATSEGSQSINLESAFGKRDEFTGYLGPIC